MTHFRVRVHLLHSPPASRRLLGVVHLGDAWSASLEMDEGYREGWLCLLSPEAPSDMIVPGSYFSLHVGPHVVADVDVLEVVP